MRGIQTDIWNTSEQPEDSRAVLSSAIRKASGGYARRRIRQNSSVQNKGILANSTTRVVAKFGIPDNPMKECYYASIKESRAEVFEHSCYTQEP